MDELRSAPTDDSMEERATGGRATVWFLVEGNRWLVTVLLLLFVYVSVVLLSHFGYGSAAKLLEMDPILALFTPIVIGVIMGVSLVLTFNQLVLEQELVPVGEQRERMAGSVAFREEVEETLESGVSPPEPSAFLRGLVEATGRSAEQLVASVEPDGDERMREEVTAFATAVREDAERVREELQGEQFGEFAVVKAALDYNYSWKIYAARNLRHEHADSLSAETREALDTLIDVLEFFGPTREHFKSLYFRWDIVNVSKALAYTALPALIVAAYVLLVFEPADVPGSVVGIDASLLFVVGAFVVGIVPFTVFIVYILRIVTIAKWTLAIGPFILRETERETEDFDWL